MGTGQQSFDNSIRLASRLRPLAILVAIGVPVVGFWLFGDTYDRHFGQRRTPNVIRFAHFGTYQDYLLFKNVVADFNETNRDVRVVQEYVAGLSGHYRTKLRQEALVDNLPDVALVQLAFFREHAELFEDLSRLTTETLAGEGEPLTLDPVGLEAFKRNGVQSGLPISGGPLVIYLNKKCFRRVAEHTGEPIGLPPPDWTVSEFQKTAEYLTRDFDGDNNLDQFGFYLPRWIYFLPFIWSHGATITDSTTSHWSFVGNEAIRAMTLYQELALTRRATPRDYEVAQLFQDTAFLTGKIGMCVNGPWFQPFLNETSMRDDYLVLPVPRSSGGSITRVTWDGVVVARNLAQARRELAQRLVRHLLSRNVQLRIAQTGKALPARRDTILDFAAAPQARTIFVSSIETARLDPSWKNFRAIDRTINAHLRKLTSEKDNVSPAAMIKALASDHVITENFAEKPVLKP